MRVFERCSRAAELLARLGAVLDAIYAVYTKGWTETGVAGASELAKEAIWLGRRKSYVINLNMVKRSETRTSRIAKFRDHILAGKGALER
ncbi:YdeI/OmpD-associated family protein [Sinorhizobium alkalisoli]|uniref:Uncharacterized protein n=1 Tax=Sinorhizobium alkalisoli TaxID=1752398 RepID=A0A1E3V7L1_9HYPH|nr:YdeI/OmpD-associated family protein [Sinorhizobium alkalisoli]ODR89509.1 hypothetical protein A8M32_19470 [Sinorhizobium alkalisoli]